MIALFKPPKGFNPGGVMKKARPAAKKRPAAKGKPKKHAAAPKARLKLPKGFNPGGVMKRPSKPVRPVPRTVTP